MQESLARESPLVLMRLDYSFVKIWPIFELSSVYTCKHLTVCQQVCSHCLFVVVDKSGTSCYHLVKLVIQTSKFSMTSFYVYATNFI